MAKTYLDLINIVLRDINEVPLTATSFLAPRGLQAFVKEAVNRSLMDVINYNDEWPWLTSDVLNPGTSAHTHEFTTVAGITEYQLPSGIDEIDYDNITFLPKDSDDSTSPYLLKFIDYNEVLTIASDVDGTDTPRYSYQTPSKGYLGIYPKPTSGHTVRYIAWKEPTFLTDATDTLPFEDRYYTVIVSRARYYAWLFRENAQQASMALNEYDENLRTMYKNIVLPRARTMRAV